MVEVPGADCDGIEWPGLGGTVGARTPIKVEKRVLRYADMESGQPATAGQTIR